MRNIEVLKVNAFTTADGKGGNPAGIVLTEGLDEGEMQEIAKKAGLSETAFISQSDKADYRMDFFTPIRRIADCGHATVAGFSVLSGKNPSLSDISKEIEDGIRTIRIRDQKVFLEQSLAKFEDLPPEIFSALFESNERPLVSKIARNDVGYALFWVSSQEALKKLVPRLDEIQKFSEKNDLVGIYVYTMTEKESHIATARMFAPAYGINEESATGMAAALLGSWLHLQNPKLEKFAVEQGRFMDPPSPSLLFCEVEAKKARIFVGGSASIKETTTIHLES